MKKNKLENEIELLEKQITELNAKLELLKEEKLMKDLRLDIKNELKSYIIQKLINTPKSVKIFTDVNNMVNEILKEIKFDEYLTNSSNMKENLKKEKADDFLEKTTIKGNMKNEFFDKITKSFKFSQNGNISTLESFKN